MTLRILDPYYPGQSAIHLADARVKLLVALAWILAINLTPATLWPLYALYLLAWLGALLAAGVPPWEVAKRSALAAPFVLFAALGAPLTAGGRVLWSRAILGWQATITDLGLWRFATVLGRAWLSVLVAVGLGATTAFTDLVRAMRALGLPAVLASVVLMMYRYLFVLADEAQRLLRAREARSASLPDRRGGRSLAWRAQVSGHMIATLFLRTYERSERIYRAMLSRGYRGEERHLAAHPKPHGPAQGRGSAAPAPLALNDEEPMATNMPIVELEDLAYTYPDGHRALRGITLAVAAGEKVALVGANGAGKSTLLLHLNGLLHGDGQVRIGGLPVSEENARLVRARVGLVFQDPDDQLFSPTVLDDVAFGPLHMGLEDEAVLARSAWALSQVQMDGFDARMPHRLSLGERKRVSVATVLSMEPQILALDEPSAGLDPAARHNLIQVLRALPQTMLIASHDLDFVRALCTRAVVLREGRLAADVPIEDLTEDLLANG